MTTTHSNTSNKIVFATKEEALDVADRRAAREAAVVVIQIVESFAVLGDAELQRFEDEAQPVWHLGDVSNVLIRKAAHDRARRVFREEKQVGIVVRVPNGFRVYDSDNLGQIPNALIDAVLPRKQCSFCAAQAASGSGGLAGPRLSACPNCEERLRAAPAATLAALSEAEATSCDPSCLEEMSFNCIEDAEAAARQLAALRGETVWAFPFCEAFRVACESDLQNAVVAAIVRPQVAELSSSPSTKIAEAVDEIADAEQITLGVVQVDETILLFDANEALIPSPFCRCVVEPSAQCDECGVGGLYPPAGDAYYILGGVYCRACKDELCDSDPEFFHAWGNDW
jgi:hypothetical protein